jgi:hypothetical protein
MDLLNNPWVIGIGGGILSSLFVAWVTRIIFSKRDNKEYLQKLRAANQEVLYAIRPGISEEVIPSSDVVAHLISATSRRYGVDAELMYSVNEIASELIKEVMDSSFISASTKKNFCEKLSKLIPATPTTVKNRVSELREAGKYKSQTTRVMAMMAGLMTGFGAATIASKDILSLRDPDTVFLLLVPALIAVLVSLTSVFMREMQNSKLAKFTFNMAGIRAEFEPKNKSDSDPIHNK